MSRTLPILLSLLMLSPAAVEAAETARDKSALPATPEAWLSQMLDGKRNGAAFKDPQAFAEWLDAITEPRFMTALAATTVDPATYPKALANAIDPQTARNWSEFTDPQLYLRWMLAGASPAFQQAILRKLSDPAKMARWTEAMSHPEAYAAMAATFAQAPVTWMAAPMNPANYAPVAKALQPATPMAWFGALAEGVAKPFDGQAWQQLPDAKLSAVRYRY